MRLSKSFWQTYKETPKDAEIPSHQFLMRAGFLHKVGSGLYQYLPFATKVLNKIEAIVREEMDRVGGQEVKMSLVTPGELWKESGRWDLMSDLMLKFKDRGEKDVCISPTNEETVTDIFRKSVKSYKQLPINLYQINTKFRDEIRPRFGLMRAREFIMKDAYTFHDSKECLDKVYADIYAAYEEILKRIGLNFIVVEADAGAMGSSDSKTHEFQVVAETGEDTIVYTEDGEYAANLEKAETTRKKLEFDDSNEEISEVETPNAKTIEDVCKSLKSPKHHSLKSLVYTAITGEKEEHYLVMLLGDDELNDVKLKNTLGCDNLLMTRDKTLEELGLIKGYIGPYKMKALKILFDKAIDVDASYVIGANKEGFHLKNFIPNRDSSEFKVSDLRLSQEGDYAADGTSPVQLRKGIEVGHIFQLGDKYTKAMGTTVLDKNGKQLFPLMGCYGIGVSRIMAAAIEQHHDNFGICWPKAIAPFHIYFACIAKSDEIKNLSNELYEEMKSEGLEILFDDRGLGPGSMFKDADLLGLPIRVTLGERDYKADQKLEIRVRKTGECLKVSREDLIHTVKEVLGKAL